MRPALSCSVWLPFSKGCTRCHAVLLIIWAASAVPFSVTDAAVCLVLCSWHAALTLLWGISAAPQPAHIYPGLLETCPASHPGHSSERVPLTWLLCRHPGNPPFSLLAKSQHETFVTCPASKMCSSSVASVHLLCTRSSHFMAFYLTSPISDKALLSDSPQLVSFSIVFASRGVLVHQCVCNRGCLSHIVVACSRELCWVIFSSLLSCQEMPSVFLAGVLIRPIKKIKKKKIINPSEHGLP